MFTRTSARLGSVCLVVCTGSTRALRVRALGFIQYSVSITVGSAVQPVLVTMAATPQRLPEITTSATHLGIRGIIFSEDGQPVADASVLLLGRGAMARTDSQGASALPASAGSHTMQIERRGFATQLASVRESEREGTTIYLWLRAADWDDEGQIMMRANLFDIQRSLLRIGNTRTYVFNRQDVQRVNSGDLRLVIRSLVAVPPRAEACATISGGLRRAPLFEIDPNDIELLITPPTQSTRTTERAELASRTRSIPDACAYQVWTR
jgi:hypothetical protein